MFRKDRGKCGRHIKWQLKSPCDLYIEGYGEMYDMPWGNVEKQKTIDFCKKIVTVEMVGDITTIGKYGFAAFVNMSQCLLPQSLVLVDEWAFAHCQGIQYFALPQSVQLIAQGAFYECYNLEVIKIPQSTTVAGNAFLNCDKARLYFV